MGIQNLAPMRTLECKNCEEIESDDENYENESEKVGGREGLTHALAGQRINLWILWRADPS
jgi:hypothetical protein